jgi:hypothetical protein
MYWPLHYYSTFLFIGENTAHIPLILHGTFKPNHCLWYVHQTLSDTHMLASGASYNETSGTKRWGDYQSACLDPSSGALVWITGQIGLFLHPNFATPALGLRIELERRRCGKVKMKYSPNINPGGNCLCILILRAHSGSR